VCRETALKYTWEACTRQFLTHIETANRQVQAAATTPAKTASG
jgi:hypothetical protein